MAKSMRLIFPFQGSPSETWKTVIVIGDIAVEVAGAGIHIVLTMYQVLLFRSACSSTPRKNGVLYQVPTSCLFYTWGFLVVQQQRICLQCRSLRSHEFDPWVEMLHWRSKWQLTPVHHQLPELAQTHVHRVGDAIQPSHPLLSPLPPAFNLSQHQGLF